MYTFSNNFWCFEAGNADTIGDEEVPGKIKNLSKS